MVLTTGPSSTSSSERTPPPLNGLEDDARLRAIVAWVIVTAPELPRATPPSRAAGLPSIVLLVIPASKPAKSATPPPLPKSGSGAPQLPTRLCPTQERSKLRLRTAKTPPPAADENPSPALLP
jgi:hypothetical protein